MAFKNKLLAALLVALSILNFIGCDGSFVGTGEDENNIGNRLKTVTNIKAADGSQNATIAMFDDVLRKIHQFNVISMKKLRTLEVQDADAKHYVLHDPAGNYIIDLTLKGITIFDSKSKAQRNPIKMPSTPKSAAFSATLGYLIIYDELMNVGIVKLNTTGQVIDSLLLGSVVGDDTIRSGDLLENGVLALALSDNSIAQVDIEDTLNQSKWVYTSVPTTLTGMSWLAPVAGQPTRAFVKHSAGVALVDVTNGSTVDSKDVKDYFKKLSKLSTAHVVTGANNHITLMYVDGNTIKTRKMYDQPERIMTSQLDINADNWTIVGVDEYYTFDIWDLDVNLVKTKRQLKTFNVSSMLSKPMVRLPDKAQILMGSDYYFALFPKDLGHAMKKNFITGEKVEIKGFNIKEFDR